MEEVVKQDLAALAIECRAAADTLADMRTFQTGQGTLRQAADAIEAQATEIARLTAEVETLTTCGIIEVAVRNPSVNDYMLHWETRAEKAEAALSESQAREAMAFEVAAKHLDPEQARPTDYDRNKRTAYDAGYHDARKSDAAIVRALTPADAQAALDARIDAAREEGRIAGLREAADAFPDDLPFVAMLLTGVRKTILAKIKEVGHG